MIISYGFGYHLKSDLLQDISTISGGDGFAFIFIFIAWKYIYSWIE